jgi:hypothetical protein
VGINEIKMKEQAVKRTDKSFTSARFRTSSSSSHLYGTFHARGHVTKSVRRASGQKDSFAQRRKEAKKARKELNAYLS